MKLWPEPWSSRGFAGNGRAFHMQKLYSRFDRTTDCYEKETLMQGHIRVGMTAFFGT